MCVCVCVCVVCKCVCKCVHVCVYLWLLSTEEIGPRSSRVSQSKAPLVGESPGEGSEELAAKVGEGRATLRLKQNGQAVVEQVVSCSWPGNELQKRVESNKTSTIVQ